MNVAETIASVNSVTFMNDGYTLSGSGTITMTGTGGKITTGASTDTINCTIGGSVGLTKIGSGTLVLTGANTYTGLTTISAGTLQVGNGGTTGNISSNVNNSGTLAFDFSTTQTYTGNISGGGGLTQMGTGRITLTGSNSYTGLTTVLAGGTIELGANAQATVLANGADIEHSATAIGAGVRLLGHGCRGGLAVLHPIRPALGPVRGLGGEYGWWR